MASAPGWTVVDGPIGALTVIAGPAGVSRVYFADSTPAQEPAARCRLPEVEAQLGRYFAGELRAFDLELDPRGTPLQLAVWRQLLAIPYGQTSSYGEVAGGIDEALFDAGLEPYRRPRVVGAAIGANPLAVIVPCHRVIGADGSLTGYYGGLERKRTLLELEGLTISGDCVRREAEKQQLAML
jgi:methylated-DNA-[protein]-cysteine S-methyltransferase